MNDLDSQSSPFSLAVLLGSDPHLSAFAKLWRAKALLSGDFAAIDNRSFAQRDSPYQVVAAFEVQPPRYA